MTQVVTGLQQTLMLYAPSFTEKARLYNESRFDSKAEVVPVFNWKGILGLLASRAAVGRLVLFIEGSSGYFLFDRGESGGLAGGLVSLQSAAESYQALKKKPVIGTVDLDGCNMGADLEAVRDFGLALGAEEISAVNQFHFFGLLRARGSRGNTAQLEKDIHAYNGYIATPNVNGWLGLAKSAGIDRIFLTEWFTSSVQLGKIPLPSDANNRQGYYRRADLQLRTVAQPADLRRVQLAIDMEPRPSQTRIILGNFTSKPKTQK
jgi:hypothetical protein